MICYASLAVRFLLISALLPLSLLGCAAPERTANGGNQLTTAERDDILVGQWEGTSVSECSGMAPCRGLKNITLTMLPSNNGIGGYYRCEQSTSACQAYNDRGVISNASVSHRLLSLDVVLPDDQSCIFRGRPQPQLDEMEGRFYCEQRAIMIDRGVWRAERSF